MVVLLSLFLFSLSIQSSSFSGFAFYFLLFIRYHLLGSVPGFIYYSFHFRLCGSKNAAYDSYEEVQPSRGSNLFAAPFRHDENEHPRENG